MSDTSPTSPTISVDFEWVVTCPYDPPHEHRYPADWQFGGANGCDPRGDRRWRPATYLYYSDKLELLHLTQVPLCDEQAIDEFTTVAGFGPGFSPRWLQVQRPGERQPSTLPVEYEKSTDTVWENAE